MSADYARRGSKRCARYILHKEVNDMQEITVAEALAAWEQAGQTVEINEGRCQWTE